MTVQLLSWRRFAELLALIDRGGGVPDSELEAFTEQRVLASTAVMASDPPSVSNPRPRSSNG